MSIEEWISLREGVNYIIEHDPLGILRLAEMYRTHDTPPYDTSREELIANLVEPTIELQGDTEDSIREWLISNPIVGDVWQDVGNDLAIERIQ